MGEDEAGTLAALKTHRNELIGFRSHDEWSGGMISTNQEVIWGMSVQELDHEHSGECSLLVGVPKKGGPHTPNGGFADVSEVHKLRTK